MRKLAISCLVIAAITLILAVVTRAMGGSLLIPGIPGAIIPLTFLKITKLINNFFNYNKIVITSILVDLVFPSISYAMTVIVCLLIILLKLLIFVKLYS